jgi:hypothetical protein
MSEQLVMLVSKGKLEQGKLEPRGPRWQWEKVTATHWVAYPDRLIAVADMEDDHLRRTLAYLAGWSAETVFRRGFYREIRLGGCLDSGYGMENMPTSREMMEGLVPCLTALEGEARKRGLEVPKIPSFECPVLAKRAAAQAKREAKAVVPPAPRPPPAQPKKRRK